MSSTQDALRQLGLKAGFIYNIGVDRADPDDVAHIKVVNSAGALGVVILILYDSFYLVWDFVNLWPLIAANLGFTVGYLTVIGLDGLGQNRAAQVLLFSVAFANITVATAFLGTESGIHLILIGMAALSLVSVRADNHAAKVLLIAISTLLFIVNHAFFAQGLAPDYPAAIMIVIYGISAASAISLVALPTLLYHYQLKQAETRVEAKERLLRAAMDNMTDGIYMLDENLDYLLVNRRYRDLVDLPGDPIREGGPVIDAIRAHAERGDYGPGEPDRIVADRLTALGDGSSGQKEMVIDDGERILDLRKAPIDGGGAVVVVSDVTKQRKALKDLNANKALLDGIFENCGSLVFVKDERGHYLLVNKFWEDLIGMDRSEVVGKDDFTIFPEAAEDLRANDRSVMQSAKVIQSEEVIDHTGGEFTFLSQKFPLYGGDGEVAGICGISTDITERKAAEGALNNAYDVISSSIQYASRIQRALLPGGRLMKEAFADHFCIWEPRDVVGGDMYWVKQDRRGFLVGLLDCTGHGVPGALMTTIAVSALDVAFAETGDPARLLARVNVIVKQALGQVDKEGPSDDGLEMGVCLLEPDRMRLTYAGARFNLLSAIGEEIETIKGDKSSLGYRHVDENFRFTNHSIRLHRGQKFYMFSDGITDQIGGSNGRAFGRKRTVNFLRDVAHLPMQRQGTAFLRHFTEYQGDGLRRDDVSMIGFMPLR